MTVPALVAEAGVKVATTMIRDAEQLAGTVVPVFVFGWRVRENVQETPGSSTKILGRVWVVLV